MSETRTPYGVSGRPGPNPSTLLTSDHPDYMQPSNLDVAAIQHQLVLSGSELARITGVNPRTVRKWLAPPEALNHTPMPYAAWRALLLETKTVAPVGLEVFRNAANPLNF